MSIIRSYRDLVVWQKAMDVAEMVYRHTASFPASEHFNLTSQLRRAAVSVSLNIAEGYGRNSTKSYINFLRQSRGSLNEVESALILSQRLGFSKESDVIDVLAKVDEVGRMLNSLIASLNKDLNSKLKNISANVKSQAVHS